MSERETCRTKLENLQAELAEASRQNAMHESAIATARGCLDELKGALANSEREITRVKADWHAMCGVEHDLKAELATARERIEIRDQDLRNRDAHIVELKREFVEAHKQMENMGRGHVEETNRLAQERDNARERITELETSRSDHLNDPDQIASLEAELADNAMSDLRAEYDRLKTQLAAALRCDVTADQLQTLREFGYGTYVEDHASLAAAIADIERRVG